MCLDPISAASSALSDSSCPQRGKPTPVRSPAPGTAPGPPPRRAGLCGRAAAALPFLEGTIPINFSGRTGPAAQSRTGFPSPYSASRARPALAAAQHSTALHGAAQPQPAAVRMGLQRPRPRSCCCRWPCRHGEPTGAAQGAVLCCAVLCCAVLHARGAQQRARTAPALLCLGMRWLQSAHTCHRAPHASVSSQRATHPSQEVLFTGSATF